MVDILNIKSKLRVFRSHRRKLGSSYGGLGTEFFLGGVLAENRYFNLCYVINAVRKPEIKVNREGA